MARKERTNASRTVPLAEIDSQYQRLPSSAVKLTSAERRLLKDPNWIDEDEADVIIAMRIEREEGNTAIPFREYLKSRGRSVED